jgi:hypothetical protein
VRGDYDAEKKVRFKYPNMGIVPVAMANVSYNFYDNKNCTGETVACTLYEKPEKK